jgi:hypothetical protein
MVEDNPSALKTVCKTLRDRVPIDELQPQRQLDEQIKLDSYTDSSLRVCVLSLHLILSEMFPPNHTSSS